MPLPRPPGGSRGRSKPPDVSPGTRTDRSKSKAGGSQSSSKRRSKRPLLPPQTYATWPVRTRLFLLHLVVVLLLIILLAVPPNSAGNATAVVRVGTEGTYLGLLQICDSHRCSGFFSSLNGTSTTSSTGNSTASDLASKLTDLVHARGLNSTRSASPSPSNKSLDSILYAFYMQTSLLALSIVILQVFIFLFTLYRALLHTKPKPLPDKPAASDDPSSAGSDTSLCGCCPSLSLGLKSDRLKRWVFRTNRVFLVVSTTCTLAVALDCVDKARRITGYSGVGPGVGVLIVCFLLLVLCCLIDLPSEHSRVRRALVKQPATLRGWREGSCSACCFCISRDLEEGTGPGTSSSRGGRGEGRPP